MGQYDMMEIRGEFVRFETSKEGITGNKPCAVRFIRISSIDNLAIDEGCNVAVLLRSGDEVGSFFLEEKAIQVLIDKVTEQAPQQ